MAQAPVLQLPRRLAIQLLAHAQQLPPEAALQGFLIGEAPDGLRFQGGQPDQAVPVWAWVRSQSGTGAPGEVPPGSPRVLTVALDTKGVLQLRCWQRSGQRLQECILQIRD